MVRLLLRKFLSNTQKLLRKVFKLENFIHNSLFSLLVRTIRPAGAYVDNIVIQAICDKENISTVVHREKKELYHIKSSLTDKVDHEFHLLYVNDSHYNILIPIADD